MIVKLSFFTESILEPNEFKKEKQEVTIHSFQEIIKVTSDAQNALYENAAFIPKKIFDRYRSVYEKANVLFWKYEKRLRTYSKGELEYSEPVTKEDGLAAKKIEALMNSTNSQLREYLNTLSIVE